MFPIDSVYVIILSPPRKTNLSSTYPRTSMPLGSVGSQAPRASIREEFSILNTRYTVRVREGNTHVKHKRARYRLTRTNGPVLQQMHYSWRATTDRSFSAVVPHS